MTSSVDIEERVSSSKLSSTIGVAIFKSTELRRVCERDRKRRVDSSERERESREQGSLRKGDGMYTYRHIWAEQG